MNTDEVAALLARALLYDERVGITEYDIALWGEALASYTYDDCERAINEHYADEPDTRINAGHVKRRVKAIVNDRYERSDLDSPERRALEAASERKAGDVQQVERGYARGTYTQFDAAGWNYGDATTFEERAEARVELDARIDVFLSKPGNAGLSRAEAEQAVRRGDRARAESFLRSVGRSELIGQLGEQPPGEDTDTVVDLEPDEFESMKAFSFSEPRRPQQEDL